MLNANEYKYTFYMRRLALSIPSSYQKHTVVAVAADIVNVFLFAQSFMRNVQEKLNWQLSGADNLIAIVEINGIDMWCVYCVTQCIAYAYNTDILIICEFVHARAM